jgi:hypothetical protein
MATSTDLRAAIEEVQGQLPASQEQEGAAGPVCEPDVLGRLARRVGALPWWVISAATHAVLFLLIALLATAVAPVKTDEVIISTDVVKQKPPEFDPQKKRDIFKNTKDVQADAQVEHPVVTHEKMDEGETFQTDNNMDKGTSRGTEDAISDIPLGGTGTAGSIGVGGGGMAGVFGYRDGGSRKKAVGRFGGSEATESSVEAALRWLARHQDPDGHWSYAEHEGKDPYDNLAKYDVAMTGVALLAFLGAGYTEKDGRYRDNVFRAQNWLLKQQKPDGSWTTFMYTQGMATLAIVESYGMTKNPRFAEPAQKAADYISEAQRPYEGWDYEPYKTYANKDAGQTDSSASSWQMQAMKSARISGLKVDGKVFQGMLAWLDAGQALDDSTAGKMGCTTYRGTVKNPGGHGGSPAVMSVAAMSRMFAGQELKHPGIERPVNWISSSNGGKPNLQWPDEATVRGARGFNFYYFYYGTMACFQHGGEPWQKWNTAIKEMLTKHQCQGAAAGQSACKCADKSNDGSWPPEHGNDLKAGRVFTTALGALTLEVYYRYLPMYSK